MEVGPEGRQTWRCSVQSMRLLSFLPMPLPKTCFTTEAGTVAACCAARFRLKPARTAAPRIHQMKSLSQERAARRQASAMQLLLLLLAAVLHTPAQAAAPSARLIVEWTDAAIAAAEVAAAAAGASAASAGDAAVTAAASASLASTTAAAAAAAGIQVLGRRATYTSVLRGAALQVGSDADARALQQQLLRNPAVKNAWLAGRRRLVRPVQQGGGGAAAADGAAAAAATPAKASATTGSSVTTGLASIPAYANSTLNGTGVLVCVVDTGIGYRTAMFGSCTGINSPRGQCGVIRGSDFVGDQYAGSPDTPPVSDTDPMDCEGHGTMVASVAATSNGVARGAKLGAYRVIGCKDGFTSDDIILEALDRAVSDGCNIINLSLGSTSGYTEHSVYATVMRNAFNRGVLVVKAAGNSGEDGPFTADGTLATGCISAAAAGYSDTTVDTQLLMSGYSSFGPAPNLGLLPHVAAPGTNIRVITRSGFVETATGTSLASPYVAGALALWLQHKRAAAAAAGSTLQPLTVNQDAAIRGLVTTALPISDPDNDAFVEPVARAGAGMLKVDALLDNQLVIKPHYLSLPSSLGSGTFSANITLAWQGASHPAGTLRYSLAHSPATAISVVDGWYGTEAMQRVYESAQLVFQPSSVSVNTRTRRPVTVQVTFTLPAVLQARPLLYSGLIRLLPAATSGTRSAVRPPPLSVPYQGYSGAWSALTLHARVNEPLNLRYSMELTEKAPALCYTPGGVMRHVGMRFDYWSPIPGACADGGFAATDADVLSVSLEELRATRGCSLRITLAPQAPVRRLAVELLGGDGAVLGSLPTLDVSGADDCLVPARTVGSYCLQFDGDFRDVSGVTRSVRVGSTYRLRARLEGPLALADRARGIRARNTVVAIRGRFLVTQ